MSEENRIDLHVHTLASDGLLSPWEIVKKAKEEGLRAIGICDHDSQAGIAEAAEAGEKFGMEVVPGIELSTLHQDKDLHILGYYVDFTSQPFREKLAFFAFKRKERAQKIVGKLAKLGFKLDIEAVCKKAGNAPIVKPHIVMAVFTESANKERLQEEFGENLSVGSFIQHYLEFGKPAYVAKVKVTVGEAINLIHQNKGIAVLAHPGLDLECTSKQDELIQQFKTDGLDGIEAISFTIDMDKTKICLKHYMQLAKRLELLITGGSDYHGYICPSERIGAEMGFKGMPMSVDYKYLTAMKTYLKARK